MPYYWKRKAKTNNVARRVPTFLNPKRNHYQPVVPPSLPPLTPSPRRRGLLAAALHPLFILTHQIQNDSFHYWLPYTKIKGIMCRRQHVYMPQIACLYASDSASIYGIYLTKNMTGFQAVTALSCSESTNQKRQKSPDSANNCHFSPTDEADFFITLHSENKTNSTIDFTLKCIQALPARNRYLLKLKCQNCRLQT